MDRASLEQIIRDNVERSNAAFRKREQTLPLDLDRIITLTGARRTGKTSLFFRVIEDLRKKVPAERLLYINFEDDRLFGMELSDMNTLLEAYFTLYPSTQNKLVYFFFDEIQRIKGWETFVRRIKDTLTARVFVTGSSASLLGREIATALRGRTLSYEVFPLRFSEYLNWQRLPSAIGTSQTNQKIQHAFRQYMETTAFPELINWSENERVMALQEYIDLIIYRDVAERLNITNTQILKYLIQFLLVNAGKPLSANSIYKDMKGQGLKISKDTLYEYLGLLEDVYAIFMIPIYSRNLKVQQRNPKKLYILDHGLKKAVSVGVDKGALLENIVFIDFRRRYRDIYYWQEGQEVDFIIPTNTGPRAVNVTFSIAQSSTYDREISGLKKCMSALHLTEGWIITAFEEKEVSLDDIEIHIIPAWKWLLAPGF
jgi:predicted AAA+ superfamily ATPase